MDAIPLPRTLQLVTENLLVSGREAVLATVQFGCAQLTTAP